jgi:hypothetical protein
MALQGRVVQRRDVPRPDGQTVHQEGRCRAAQGSGTVHQARQRAPSGSRKAPQDGRQRGARDQQRRGQRDQQQVLDHVHGEQRTAEGIER